jgi:hypothetical protein|tara:strand:- start:1333 stop:1500 length:168 start_codon:yes stop_codon:yes gene_type:complete
MLEGYQTKDIRKTPNKDGKSLERGWYWHQASQKFYRWLNLPGKENGKRAEVEEKA